MEQPSATNLRRPWKAALLRLVGGFLLGLIASVLLGPLLGQAAASLGAIVGIYVMSTGLDRLLWPPGASTPLWARGLLSALAALALWYALTFLITLPPAAG